MLQVTPITEINSGRIEEGDRFTFSVVQATRQPIIDL